SRARRLRRRYASSSRSRRRAISRRARPAAPLCVPAPAIFALESEDHRNQLMQMIDTIRKCVLSEQRIVVVDFASTQLMFPSGTLRFKAEIDRLLQMPGNQDLIRGKYPEDLVVEQVLQKVGLLSMLGLDERRD